jgi:hypothetical protein
MSLAQATVLRGKGNSVAVAAAWVFGSGARCYRTTSKSMGLGAGLALLDFVLAR